MRNKNLLGMGAFLFAEANFFLILILAYVYFHVQPINGPTARTSLDPARTAIYTVFLLASSVTLWLAGRSLKGSGARIWLLVTIVFGAVFLVGQGTEYARLLGQNVSISSNVFGSSFFTLTGFHGLHVLSGLIALTILFGFAVAGGPQGLRPAAFETISLYWHFVDAVWIVIFSVVYLWALL